MTKKKIGKIVKENVNTYLKVIRQNVLVPVSNRQREYSMCNKTLYTLISKWEDLGLIDVDESNKNLYITPTEKGKKYANILSETSKVFDFF